MSRVRRIGSKEASMRLLAWLVGAVLMLAVGVGLLQIIASETGEVVVLTTLDGESARTTRLWVVDHDGGQWLRGGPGSGWYQRLLSQPAVELERGGETRSYLAEPVPAMAATINAQMAAKYGWRDRAVSLFSGDRSDAVTVRLNAAD
jgi:hypothetical protein